MATDLLSTIQREIEERLSELRPRLAEYEQLLVAVDALLTTGPDADGQAALQTVPTVAPKRRQARARTALRGTAAGAIERARSDQAKPARAARGAARDAILAALDHGSHTVGELTVVTAMSGPNINGNLRRLLSEGAIVKTEREGKTAWALPEKAA